MLFEVFFTFKLKLEEKMKREGKGIKISHLDEKERR